MTCLTEMIASRVDLNYERYDPDEGVIIVASEGLTIRGYLGLAQFSTVLETGGAEEYCAFLPYMAVDRQLQGGDIGARLRSRADQIIAMRAPRRKHYAAVVATTVYGTAQMANFLSHMGFRQVDQNPDLWYRRIPRSLLLTSLGSRSSPPLCCDAMPGHLRVVRVDLDPEPITAKLLSDECCRACAHEWVQDQAGLTGGLATTARSE